MHRWTTPIVQQDSANRELGGWQLVGYPELSNRGTAHRISSRVLKKSLSHAV